ncbi:MAG: hypothetical protein J5896_03200 [Alphaproteobacteria bacterium]|nr:hypothetical protein [Alphaproteobacteria bacterium]
MEINWKNVNYDRVLMVLALLIGMTRHCITADRLDNATANLEEATVYIENMNTLIEAIKTGAEPSENGVYEIALSKGEVMLVYPSSDKTRPYVFSTYTKAGKPLKMIEKSSFGLKEALYHN